MARTQMVATGVIGLVVAAACAVVLATVGQSAAAEATILSRIDEAGSRTIVVADPSGRAGLRADSVVAASGLSGVAWALGFGPVEDVRNHDLGAASRPVPARPFYGTLPSEVTILGLRPTAGTAVVGDRAAAVLAEALPAGSVQRANGEATVVGRFTASAPLAFLSDGVLISLPPTEAAPLRQLFVLAESADDVDALVVSLPIAVHATSPQELSVTAPADLVSLRHIISGELAANAWRLMLLVFGVGLAVVATTLFGAVSQRRLDFGRRRALGASRSAVVLLVLVQTAAAAAFGVFVGTAVGLLALWRVVGSLPSPTFLAGVAILTLLTAVVAGIPPAITASRRDPVRILRVP